LLGDFYSLLVVVVMIPADPTDLVLATAAELLPVRIVAAIALVAA
jgi:hypothetical protein